MKPRRNWVQVWMLMGVLLHGGRSPAWCDTLQDVKHVVILMQENRSFDNYFGTLQGVRGYNDPNILVASNGLSNLFQPAEGTNYVLPFPVASLCNYHRLDYFTRTNLSFYYSLADAYTICDANFAAFNGPTFPNRIFLFSGTVDPTGAAGGPAYDNIHIPTNGYRWTTYPERLQAAGVSWKVYRPTGDWFGDALQWFTKYMNASPGNPLYDRGMTTYSDPLAVFKADVISNTLPQVSWLIPNDLTYSEHAPYSAGRGERFVQQALAALAANPAVLNSTVFILTYDEEGGYFDHLLPPLAPSGTAGEFSSSSWRGLGTRVPMIIVSPWTRGGKVCSQVFDHTSIIRFLETWTGVQETNISAWRRQTCGNLTSAFDFANPNTNLVTLPAAPAVDCNGNVQNPPAVQSLPVQEPGSRPACPLPYQPDASCRTDCGSSRFYLTMTNAGTASVHFAVYANGYRSDGPWQYDAPPGGSVNDSFFINNSSRRYDFTCYGPNGFQRRFAGYLSLDCNQIEIATRIDPAANGIALGMINSSATAANFTVTDNLNPGSPLVFSLPPANSTNSIYPVLASNHGWYDLTVTADTDAGFLRHLAGHVENGSFSFTELPVIVGNILLVPTNLPAITTTTTNPPPVVTNSVTFTINDLVNQLIAQNSLATSSTSVLKLTVGTFGTNCALIYPRWASNYVVEASINLAPSVWLPLNVTPAVVSNCDVIILPETNTGEYFRLRE